MFSAVNMDETWDGCRLDRREAPMIKKTYYDLELESN